MLRDVTQRPSLPAKGEVFTEKIMDSVGSSMWRMSRGDGFSTDVTVSPIPMPSKPARATISPQSAFSTALRSSPSNPYSFVTFVVCRVPSFLATATWSPTATRPEKMRPMARRPR
jgi:hypothetical protein